MKTFSKDYYAVDFFSNPTLEFAGCEKKSHGNCPFCDGQYESINYYVFRNKVTKKVIKVFVKAAYAECSTCGAI